MKKFKNIVIDEKYIIQFIINLIYWKEKKHLTLFVKKNYLYTKI